MSEEEKEETEQKKREGSKKGQQYVSNTEEAKEARKIAKEVPIISAHLYGGHLFEHRS
jgi:hypothetical protein